MITKKGSFRLKKDAIYKFRKLPIDIQAQIVKKACEDIGWETKFSIEIPDWAEADNKSFDVDIEDHYKCKIEAYGWAECVSSYGFYYNIYNGNTEITSTIVKDGVTVPRQVKALDRGYSFDSNQHKLRNYLNKHLKEKLPKILIDDYPEHMI